MKRYLLPEGGKFYKANLHCHTTVSDGARTPEEVKRVYTEQGYSIVAFTDHNALISQAHLQDEDFLPLNGLEYDVSKCKEKWNALSVCHLCMIALEQDNITMPLRYTSRMTAKNIDRLVFKEGYPMYERMHTPEDINYVIRRAREAGFFVTWNHPVWSNETPRDYLEYQGMNAMEIYNHGCATHGFDEHTPMIYDQMLSEGKRIYCIAADDNHDKRALDDPLSDNCGGFVMIKADRLAYRTVTRALEEGNFYASTGPQIYALWFEDGMVHVQCSPAAKIFANYGIIRSHRAIADGTPLTEASFPFEVGDRYIRITVIDENGKFAHTNAYFEDEVLGGK